MTNFNDDKMLEQLFAQERTNAFKPSTELMEKIVGDAIEQPHMQKKTEQKKTNWLANLFGALGGWQPVGAMAVCACLGLYIGYASPVTGTLIYGQEEDITSLTDDEDALSFIQDFVLEG